MTGKGHPLEEEVSLGILAAQSPLGGLSVNPSTLQLLALCLPPMFVQLKAAALTCPLFFPPGPALILAQTDLLGCFGNLISSWPGRVQRP